MYYSDYNRPPEEREPIETIHYQVSDPEPPKKKKGFAAKFVAVGLVCAIAGGLAGGAGAMALKSSGFFGSSTTVYEGSRPTAAVSLANVDGKTVLTAEQIYAANLDCVVGVNGDVTTNVWGQTVRNAVSGSGFVISSDGYILTNYHVIDGVSDIKVTFADGSSYDAVVVGGEEENDIAVLKIEAAGLHAVTLGDSDALAVGESVYAIGNPLGLNGTVTAGIISAVDREIQVGSSNMVLLQTDASINPGNSGGALLNEYGQVIGVNSAKISSEDSEGLGFAIPSNTVGPIVEELIDKGYVSGRPLTGISGRNVSALAAAFYNIPQGILVDQVAPESDAAAKGLAAGDVIIGVDDIRVENISDACTLRDEHKAGDTMKLTFYRQGSTREINIRLMEETNQQSEYDF